MGKISTQLQCLRIRGGTFIMTPAFFNHDDDYIRTGILNQDKVTMPSWPRLKCLEVELEMKPGLLYFEDFFGLRYVVDALRLTDPRKSPPPALALPPFVRPEFNELVEFASAAMIRMPRLESLALTGDAKRLSWFKRLDPALVNRRFRGSFPFLYLRETVARAAPGGAATTSTHKWIDPDDDTVFGPLAAFTSWTGWKPTEKMIRNWGELCRKVRREEEEERERELWRVRSRPW